MVDPQLLVEGAVGCMRQAAGLLTEADCPQKGQMTFAIQIYDAKIRA
jgi:hypothetical protein